MKAQGFPMPTLVNRSGRPDWAIEQDWSGYIEEPDVFHDIFGHVPLLVNPVFADCMQAYLQGGLAALARGTVARFARWWRSCASP